MISTAYLIIFSIAALQFVTCFNARSKSSNANIVKNKFIKGQKIQLSKLYSQNSDSDPIIFEVITKKVVSEIGQNTKYDQEYASDIVAYESVYNDDKEDRVSIIMDNKVFSKISTVLTNPLALLMSIYLIIIFYNKIGDSFNSFLSIFSKTKKDKRQDSTLTKLVELPYQVFECENCQMQMRPAKGRAEKIFGREKFRCSRCGAKASAYFNIDDLNDPRAVARIEKIQQEENDENYGDDDDEE